LSKNSYRESYDSSQQVRDRNKILDNSKQIKTNNYLKNNDYYSNSGHKQVVNLQIKNSLIKDSSRNYTHSKSESINSMDYLERIKSKIKEIDNRVSSMSKGKLFLI
jgi:hypothetical protein